MLSAQFVCDADRKGRYVLVCDGDTLIQIHDMLLDNGDTDSAKAIARELETADADRRARLTLPF